uniref:Uncharacterized protein n=1 Tax=Panagrolaimus sp. ES5 TaxID=591445 RepID=A0AC34F5P1_9BILA
MGTVIDPIFVFEISEVMDCTSIDTGKLPDLDDPNLIAFIEKTKDPTLISDFLELLKDHLYSNEDNGIVKSNIEQRTYYRAHYRETLKKLDEKNKEFKDSQHKKASEIDKLKKDMQLASEKSELELKGANQKIVDLQKRASTMDKLFKKVQNCAEVKVNDAKAEMQKEMDNLISKLEETDKEKDQWKTEAEKFKNGYLEASKYKKDAEKLSAELHLVNARLGAENQIRQKITALLNLPDSDLDSEVPTNPVIHDEEILDDLEVSAMENDIEHFQQHQKRSISCSENKEQPDDKKMKINDSNVITGYFENPTFWMPVLLSESSNQTSIEPLPLSSFLAQILDNQHFSTGT